MERDRLCAGEGSAVTARVQLELSTGISSRRRAERDCSCAFVVYEECPGAFSVDNEIPRCRRPSGVCARNPAHRIGPDAPHGSDGKNKEKEMCTASQTMPDELRPCPFCAGTDIVIELELLSANIFCNSCFAEAKVMRRGEVSKNMEAKWNTRPLEDELRILLKAEGDVNIALRIRLKAAEELIATMDEQERLNKEPLTNYSGFLTAFRREFHKGDVTAARKKWEAANGSIE